MMRDRDDLETQWQHVRCKARIDHLGQVNTFLSEMREALAKVPADGVKNLEVVCYGRIVKRKGHGVGFPLLHVIYRVRHSFRKLLKLQSAQRQNRCSAERWTAGQAHIVSSLLHRSRSSLLHCAQVIAAAGTAARQPNQ
jgi:hypothetical protein